jgi:putative endopeptidase
MVVGLSLKDVAFPKCICLLELGGMKYQKTRKHKSNGGIQNDLCPKDFFQCVNQSWLRSVHVPPYKAAFGVSEEIEQRIEKQLFEIASSCQQAFRKTNTTKTLPTMIGGLVDSVLKTAIQPNNIHALQFHIGRLQCMNTKEDVAKVMGEFCKAHVGTLLRIDGTYLDSQDGKYCLQIRRGTIGLPDKMYYEDSSSGRQKTLHFYKEYLNKVSHRLGLPSLDKAVDAEKKLAPYILMKKVNETEKIMHGNDLDKKYTQIPWKEFFEAYGVSDWKQRVFQVESSEWLSIINLLFKEEDVKFWKVMFLSELIHHSIAYLPPPFDDYHYDFFRKRLRGQAQKLPQKYLMLEVLAEYTTPFLSKLYKEKYCTASFRENAVKFAEEIRSAAIHRLDTVDWLQPKTRKEAQEKVKGMILSISYPDSFALSPLPEINPDCLIENIFSLGIWKTDQDIQRLGSRRKDQKGWEDPIFAVNGYYYAENNELIIPTGSLLPPFYQESKPLGWNYGGVGVIMGHEITHAFDEEGKEYDPKGHRKSWWSPGDKKNYAEKTKDIVRLYSAKKVLGHSVDGESTLSENIADLGGLAIALDALNLELEKRKASLSERKQAYRQFFISYAVSWRIKEKPEKQIQGLLVDRHAPTPLRVNLIVNQFQEWYDAFDVKEGDPMYVDPKQRLKIF